MDEDTRVGYRYMQSCYWDNQDSYEAMINHQKWAVKTFPISEESVKSIMNEGLIYVGGRCKPGHQPIIVVSGKRFHHSKN